MRWEDALDDVGSQLDAGLALDLASEVADRARRESAALMLRDRLAGSCGTRVEVVTGSGAFTGELVRVGADWLLLAGADGRLDDEVLVPLAGVERVHGLGRRTVPATSLVQRLDLGHALRGLARDRLPVLLVVRDGDRLRCRVDRVGRDFLDVVEPEEPGRRAPPREDGALPALPARRSATIPFAALVAIRRTA